ncbi:MAG: MFS transporter, partial [Anaerolineae bacterium]|nr:MFS transporter [Anaerolineae bacterium]
MFASDFNKLWFGETISSLGSSITQFALPLAAAQTLNATPTQMGWLSALAWLPMLFLGLFVGAWVDQRRRRPILIWSDSLRAILLMLIPAAAWLGWLTMPLLFAVTLIQGSLNVFFLVAYPAYLPSLVTREHIAASNAKLQLSESASQVIGPSLAGLLTQIITAPFAIALDAVSYAISALCFSLIRTPEPLPVGAEPMPAERLPKLDQPQSALVKVKNDIIAGLRFLLRHKLLRIMLVFGILANVSGGIAYAVLVLFVTRELGLNAVQFGIVMSAAGPGAIIGALVSVRLVKRLGVAPTMLVGIIMSSLSQLVFPLLTGSIWSVMTLMMSTEFIFGIGSTLWGINVMSMRQMVTPSELLGRVTASMRTLI